jgi:NADPH:quinone reductase
VFALRAGAAGLARRTRGPDQDHRCRREPPELEIRAGNWPIRKKDPFPYVPGVQVVGRVSRPEQAEGVRALGAEEVIVTPRGQPARLAPQSIDRALDSVAADLFAPRVTALRSGGVLSLVGAVAAAEVVFDGWQLMQPVTLTGYSSETLDGAGLRDAVAALCGWMTAGVLRPPNHQIVPVGGGRTCPRLIEHGGVLGRLLLRPSP